MLSTDALNFRPAYLKAAEDLRNNSEQWKVYESQGNCVVLAGPGSGKTKTITIKMARILAEDIRQPRGIACITYNSECARELKRRLEHLGITENRNIYIGTVHSFCLRNILLPYARITGIPLPDPLGVAAPSIQERLFERSVSREIGADEEARFWKTRFDRYRRTYLDRMLPEWRNDSDVSRLIEAYEHELRKHGLVDFDDMVLIGLQMVETCGWVRKLLKARFPVLVVDEYQDLGLPLHRIVLALSMKAGVRLIAVGDPDQSIYSFCGAKPELLHALAKMEGIESFRLRLNYRCGKTIVQASQITLGEQRGYESPDGAAIGTIDFYEFPGGLQEQAAQICQEIIPAILTRGKARNLGDIAVLYLDKNDGDVIAAEVANAGMKYIRIDQNAPYAKTVLIRWLEDCAAWCSGGWNLGQPRLSSLVRTWLLLNKVNDLDERSQLLRRQLVRFLWLHRVSEIPLREWLSAFDSSLLQQMFVAQPELADEREAFYRLTKVCSKEGKISDFTVAAFAGQGGSPSHLNLLTLHSSKGSEFDVVIMMGMDQGRIPRYGASESEKREPRRLFYVGLTRARYEVHMTYSGWTENRWGRRFYNGPSEFLLELRRNLDTGTGNVAQE